MHSVPRYKALFPCGCAHTALALFCKLCFCFLGKQPNWNRFQTNFFLMKEENFITSYCIMLTFKPAKLWWLVKETLVFLSIGYILFIDEDSHRKADDSDNGWVNAWFWTNWAGGEGNCVRDWWQHCNVNYQNVSIFIGVFLPYPNFAPLSPNITWARGSESLRMTWYEKG